MDADGRIIPWVEGDQGEGIKDFLEEYAEAGKRVEQSIQEHLLDRMINHEEKKGLTELGEGTDEG